MPLFDIKSPGNVNGFNGYFIEITSYDYINFDAINSKYMYMPEVDPFSLNFQMAGYDSVFIIPSLGLVYYTILAISLVVLIYFMLKPCASKCGGRIKKVRKAIRKRLFWNSIIRFFIESFLELGMCAIMNVKTLFWHQGLYSLGFNNVFAFFVTLAIIILPVALIIIYFVKRENW